MRTKFADVYDRFFGKITDDMYVEVTQEDTIRDLQSLIMDAIPGFEFPRKVISDVVIETVEINKEDLTDRDYVISGYIDENEPTVIVDRSYFEADLTSEEINILAILMLIAWTQRQVTSIENTRMKYSGSDFKMTSQANHLAKLLNLLAEVQRQSHHMQRLYKRRKSDEKGNISSNWSVLREVSALDN